MTPMRTHMTDAPPVEDERDALELSAGENASLCAGCVRCCTYVAIAVESPRASWEYDQWLWALHHEKVQMYVERPEQWFITFETRCRQLDPAGRCAIHGRHPVLCREYDPRACERRFPLTGMRAWFRNAGDLEAWLERERPAHWARLMAWRKDAPGAPAAPRPAGGAAGFIPLAAVAAGASLGDRGDS